MPMNHMRRALVKAGLVDKREAMKVESLKRELEKWERRKEKSKNNTSKFRISCDKVKELRRKLKLKDKEVN